MANASTPVRDVHPTAPLEVSTIVNFWIIEASWMMFSLMGTWKPIEPARIICIISGLIQEVKIIIVDREYQHILTWFLVYMLGRYRLQANRSWRGALERGLLLLWAITIMIGAFYPVMGIVAAVALGTMIIGVLVSQLELVCKIKQNRTPWIMDTVALILWATIWAVLGASILVKWLDTVPLVVFLMTYGACFPAKTGGRPVERIGSLKNVNCPSLERRERVRTLSR